MLASAKSPEDAVRIAEECFRITPLDTFWVNALGWLRKHHKEAVA